MISLSPNICFSYCYRDYANYKQHNEVVFANSNGLPVDEIESLIRKKLIDGEWFYASDWKLPDLHFEDWDTEIDHPLHEFIEVENTDEKPNSPITIETFLTLVVTSDPKFKVS